MTLYMLSVHHDGTEDFADISPEDMQPIFEAVDRFNKEVQEAGKWVFAGGLEPIESATTWPERSTSIAELMATIRSKLRMTWVSLVKSTARISTIGLSCTNR